MHTRQDGDEPDEITRQYARHLFAQHGLNAYVPDEYKGFKLPLMVLSEQAYSNIRPWSDVDFFLKNLPPRVAKYALLRADGRHKWTPLHNAAGLVSHSMIDCMLALAPDAARLKNSNNELPLHIAADRNVVYSIELLVKAYPGGVLEKNNHGKTPLHLAVEKRNASPFIINRILSMAPNVARVKDSRGCLPLHNAARYENVDVVNLIFNAYPGALVERNNHGKTPIDILKLDGIFHLPLMELSYHALGKHGYENNTPSLQKLSNRLREVIISWKIPKLSPML